MLRKAKAKAPRKACKRTNAFETRRRSWSLGRQGRTECNGLSVVAAPEASATAAEGCSVSFFQMCLRFYGATAQKRRSVACPNPHPEVMNQCVGRPTDHSVIWIRVSGLVGAPPPQQFPCDTHEWSGRQSRKRWKHARPRDTSM